MTSRLINKELTNLFQLRIGHSGSPLVQHSFTAYQRELRFCNSKGFPGCVVVDDGDFVQQLGHRRSLSAKAADAEALRVAAVAGEPDPGAKASEEASRALVYQEERVKAAARTVSKQSQALSALFREHRFELMEEACVTAERTVEIFQEEMSQVRKMVRDSEARRNEGLAPLRWVSSLTDSNLSYDPSFPMEGSFQLPRTSEQKVLGIVALLRKFFVVKPGEAA